MSADGRQVIDLYDGLAGASLSQTPFDGLIAKSLQGLAAQSTAHSAGHPRRNPGEKGSIDPNSTYRNIGRRFAERGCIVLCPEQIGQGDRALPEDRVTYQVLIHGLNMLGHTLIGLRYWDLVRALDLLETIAPIDRKRIGVMGLSLGGEMTLFLSALETRVRAVCICGYLTSHQSTFLDQAHCTCGHLRDLA